MTTRGRTTPKSTDGSYAPGSTANGADAAVILLPPPGGLVTATLDILQAMSASNIPVLTYVSPEGAIAASAGVFILINGHMAARATGTTGGAARPGTMHAPGEETRAAEQKTMNGRAGHRKSKDGERGRTGEMEEKGGKEKRTGEKKEEGEKGRGERKEKKGDSKGKQDWRPT